MITLGVTSLLSSCAPQFYIGKKCVFENGVGEVMLVFSSRYMDQESSGNITDIILEDEETSFLERQINSAILFFTDTLAMYGQESYSLYNGVPFFIGDSILKVPFFLEQRILHELKPYAEILRVYTVTISGSDILQ